MPLRRAALEVRHVQRCGAGDLHVSGQAPHTAAVPNPCTAPLCTGYMLWGFRPMVHFGFCCRSNLHGLDVQLSLPPTLAAMDALQVLDLGFVNSELVAAVELLVLLACD